MPAPPTPQPGRGATAPVELPPSVGDELAGWLAQDGAKTLGSLIDLFGEKSFALPFVLLLGVPALPLPPGGATHIMEVIAMLLALQLIVGARALWLPERWRRLELGGARRERFLAALMRMIRRLERLSRPRLRFLFNHRLSNIAFGLLALAGSLAAFLAPPFTGLDTLPSLAVVVLSLGVLLEDILLVLAAILLGAAGVTLEIVLGKAALSGIESLF